MPILVDKKTHLLIHGIQSDSVNSIHQLLVGGTDVVAYIDSGREGKALLDIPFFDSANRAKKNSQANTSLIFSKPEAAADAILEAEDAGISLIICNTSFVPLHDMVEVQRIFRRNMRSLLIGPGSYGVITPGQAKVGAMPNYVYTPGKVGIVSRFSTIMDEVAFHLSSRGIGQSTCVHLGDEPLLGTSFEEVISLFEKDEETYSILVIGSAEDFSCLKVGKKKIACLSVDGKKSPKGKIPIYDKIEDIFK